MDKALRERIEIIVTGIVTMAICWFALPFAWHLIEINGETLGGWRYLLYALVIFSGFCFVIMTGVALIFVLGWLFQEIAHFLGWVWKCIVHMELRPYTTVVTEDAREKREQIRRRKQRKDFLAKPRTPEQEEAYQRGYAEGHDEGYKWGVPESRKRGFQDGYSGYHRIERIISDMEEGVEYERAI